MAKIPSETRAKFYLGVMAFLGVAFGVFGVVVDAVRFVSVGALILAYAAWRRASHMERDDGR